MLCPMAILILPLRGEFVVLTYPLAGFGLLDACVDGGVRRFYPELDNTVAPVP